MDIYPLYLKNYQLVSDVSCLLLSSSVRWSISSAIWAKLASLMSTTSIDRSAMCNRWIVRTVVVNCLPHRNHVHHMYVAYAKLKTRTYLENWKEEEIDHSWSVQNGIVDVLSPDFSHTGSWAVIEMGLEDMHIKCLWIGLLREFGIDCPCICTL
jgi:hypothetical protein